jgi:hypothetical protein
MVVQGPGTDPPNGELYAGTLDLERRNLKRNGRLTYVADIYWDIPESRKEPLHKVVSAVVSINYAPAVNRHETTRIC